MKKKEIKTVDVQEYTYKQEEAKENWWNNHRII